MHRFIVKGNYETGTVVELPEEETKHALKVLRLEEGEEVELSDGCGALYAGVLTEVGKNTASVKVGERLQSSEAPISLTLYMGFPKAEKLELIVQKLTELGAVRIVPVLMKRSVVKLDEKDAAKKRERYERIALEAAKQSGRAALPVVETPIVWKQAVKRFPEHELLLVPYEGADRLHLSQLHEKYPQAKDIAYLIGPEGGIDESETEELEKNGGILLTLGKRILRTETAAIATAAIIMAMWGDV